MTQAFNLSQLANRVNTSGQLNAATGLFNQTPVANGGTGKSTVTTGALLLGAGTSAMTELTGTTPGTLVSSSPTGWTAVPAVSVAGGNYELVTYTSPATWDYTTKLAAGLKAVKIQVVGGGGNGGACATPNNPAVAGGGGGGGSSIRYMPAPAIGAPVPITAGAGTNSFGSFVTATGGANAPTTPGGSVSGPGGAGGVGTSSVALINLSGERGEQGTAPLSGAGGSGGGFYFTLGGPGRGTAGPGIAAPANNYGAGGGGAWKALGTTTLPGGAGAPGVVIIEEFY